MSPSERPAPLRSVLVVGAAGGMGHALAAHLAGTGPALTLVDRSAPTEPPAGTRVLQADLTDPDTLATVRAVDADCVVLAVPASVGEAAVTNLLAGAFDDALVVDLFSEKVWFAELMADRLPGATHLALHPLFGPGVEWEGQNLIASPAGVDDPRARALLELFEGWGVAVHETGVEEHDRLMGVVQVGVHAALVAYTRFMVSSGVDFELLDAVSTPASRVMWAMVARILDNGPEVYWEIQRENRSAAVTRRRLADAVEEVDRQCREGGEEPFDGLFDQVERMFGERLDDYVELARRLYDH